MPYVPPLIWTRSALFGYSGTARGTQLAWEAGAGAARYLSWLAILCILCRRLPPESFGVFLQCALLYRLASAALSMNVSRGLPHLMANASQERQRQIAWLFIVFLSVAAALGAFLLAWPRQLAAMALGSRELEKLSPYLAFWLFAALPGAAFRPLACLRSGRRLFFAVEAAHAAALAAIAAAIGVRGDLPTMFLGFGAAGLARALAALLLIQADYGLWSVGMDLSASKRLLGMGVFLGLAAFVEALAAAAGHVLVCHWAAPKRYAVYALGAIDLPFVAFLLAAATASATPRLTDQIGQSLYADACDTLQRSIARAALFLFPLFFYLQAAGSLWIETLFGRQYRESAQILAILLWLLPLSAARLHVFFIASGSQQTLLRIHGAALFLKAALAAALLWGTPLGLRGAALAMVLGEVAQRGCESAAAARRLGISWTAVYPWKRLGGIAGWSAAGWLAAQAIADAGAIGSAGIALFAATAFYLVWALFWLFRPHAFQAKGA